MTALKLYEAVEQLQTVDEWLHESGGEITPEIEELLAKAEGDFKTKVERVALYIGYKELEAAAVKVEEGRLAARRKRLEKAAASLTGYLLTQMQLAKISRVEGKLKTVRLQTSNPTVIVPEIPDYVLEGYFQSGFEYVTMTPASYSIDKRKLLECAKAGVDIPASIQIVQKEHIRIT